jgi:Cu/Zn superoxide dismutase
MNQGKPAAGFAAGGHYDPAHTKKHLGPLSTAGHRGDLPVLVVDNRGDATEAVTAPILQWRRFAAARSWFIPAAIITPTLRRRWAVGARALPAA